MQILESSLEADLRMLQERMLEQFAELPSLERRGRDPEAAG